MNLTQALSFADDHCTVSPSICDRCSQPVTFLFMYHTVEHLCNACFIEALYEFNDAFPFYLKHAETKQQLLKLCCAYQYDGRFFAKGPDDDPLLFFHPEEEDLPKYNARRERGNPDTVRKWRPCLDDDQAGPGPGERDCQVVQVPRHQREQCSGLGDKGGSSVKPVMVRELPMSERPTSRLLKYGAGSVSNMEILASILQTPDALHQAVTYLAKHDGLIGLARASVNELQEVDGIGPAQAARLKAAMELGRRMLIASPDDRVQIKSPADAANLMMAEMSILEQEHMRLILLDSKNYVIATPTMYIGSLNTAVIRVGELFREAIRRNCASIIVVHNHPSGTATPSPEDIAVTELIVKAGELLQVEVLDHMIIGQQCYVSLKERGLGFK